LITSDILRFEIRKCQKGLTVYNCWHNIPTMKAKLIRHDGRIMKIRKVRVGIKDLKTALNEFIGIAKDIENGTPVKKEKGVYFKGVEAFRKAITPKRIALLHAVRTEKPSSVRRLSEIAGRDVSTDIKFLEQVYKAPNQ